MIKIKKYGFVGFGETIEEATNRLANQINILRRIKALKRIAKI